MASNAITPPLSEPSPPMPSISDTTHQHQAAARASLKRHGKSFAWAAAFLGRDQADNGARLYEICRAIDDMADENPAPEATRLLSALRQALTGEKSDEPQANAVAGNVHRLEGMISLDRRALMHLIDGVEQDLTPVRLADERALIRYAYHVAGTVGLMMCDVFGVDDPTARRHAIDLGIGMQLTNIARDVLEDARLGRRYIPADWVDAAPAALVKPSDDTQAATRDAIERLLFLADRYYQSGRAGFGYLPLRPRLAIAIAAAVYRAIGLRLRQRGCDYQQGRVVVPRWRKALITIVVMLQPGLYVSRRRQHDMALHHDLDGLVAPHPASPLIKDPAA